MNKASGKLAAGVRKVKTQQKAPTTVEKATVTPAPVASKRTATPPPIPARISHPDRVWPD